MIGEARLHLHWTVTLTFLSSPPILLLAEHVYTPVSSLEAFVIVKFTLTLVIFPSPIGVLTPSLTDTLSLKIPLIVFHTTVGGGYPTASHVIVVVFPSLITTVVLSVKISILGMTNIWKMEKHTVKYNATNFDIRKSNKNSY